MICPACHAPLEGAPAACTACGAPTLVAGRFRLLRRVGSGAQGLVYLAEDDQRGGRVAVKELPGQAALDDRARARFERESQVLRQLAHPAIPRWVGTWVEGRGRGRCLYLVQEFVEGVSLADELPQHRYTEAEVLEIVRELCGVLAYLHDLSPPVVHRDLKPGNVIRRASDGRLVLVDFGSVRDAVKAEGGSTTGGTFGYMAPEQFAGLAEPRSDLYGLGALAIALLSRRDPSALHARGGSFDWEDHVRLRPGTQALLRALVAPDLADRPASARAVAQAVDALLRAPEQDPLPAARAPQAEGAPPVRDADRAAPPWPLPELERGELELRRPAPPAGGGPPHSIPPHSVSPHSGLKTTSILGIATLAAILAAVATGALVQRLQDGLVAERPVQDEQSPTPTQATSCSFGGIPDDLALEPPDAPPEAVERVAPRFPKGEAGSATQARCVVRALVDEVGVIAAAEVGHGDEMNCTTAFRAAVCTALPGWRFAPAVRADTRVPAEHQLTFRFRRTD